MAYQYKSDHLKMKMGRPRKYKDGIQPKPKRTVQQAAEEDKGVPVVQLDYYTGEYIGEYPSISSCAYDSGISETTLLGAFTRNGHPAIAISRKYEIIIMKKSAYENLIKGVVK